MFLVSDIFGVMIEQFCFEPGMASVPEVYTDVPYATDFEVSC